MNPPSLPNRATCFAPGSIGNLGPGLDVLGLAVAGAGDTVEARWMHGEEDVVILDPGHPDLPTGAHAHAAGLAARAVLERAGPRGEPRRTIGIRVTKGLPLSAGQGGSAASAAAAAGAVNALLGGPLDRRGLVEAALVAESAVAGRHADNLAPSIYGGLVLIRSLDPLDLVPLPVPDGLQVVLVLPDMALRTADARAVLPSQIRRDDAIHQSAQVGAIVAAALTGDLALLGRAIDDRVAEPARSALLPGFEQAKAAALGAGALGCSISGAGPTAFALADDAGAATRIGAAMEAAYRAAGLAARVRVAAPDRTGLQVTV